MSPPVYPRGETTKTHVNDEKHTLNLLTACSSPLFAAGMLGQSYQGVAVGGLRAARRARCGGRRKQEMATWHMARYVGHIENSTRVSGWMVVHSQPRKSARGAATDEEVGLMVGGTVKWFSEKKGYGFIAPDDGGRISSSTTRV